MNLFSGRTSTTTRYSPRGGRSRDRRFRRKRQTRCDRPKSRLEVGEALVEVVLGVLIVGVLLELRLGHRAQERLHAHLALDVHRLGVARQLRACGRRKRSGQRVSQTRARWVMIRRTRNHPHRRGGVRRGPRSRRAQEPGAASCRHRRRKLSWRMNRPELFRANASRTLRGLLRLGELIRARLGGFLRVTTSHRDSRSESAESNTASRGKTVGYKEFDKRI